MVNWKKYEYEKEKLIEKKLSPEEYEKAIKELVVKYRL